MWRRHEGALRRAIAGLALALLSGTAAAEELALLELVVDGRATQRVEGFVLRDGQPYATRSLWRSLGVRDASGASADESISVAALPGVQARLDLAGRTLALQQPPDPAALTLIERGLPADAPPLDHGSGLLLNYDLSRQQGGGRAHGAGLLDGRWFGALGVLEHALLLSDGPGAQHRRLSTSFTQADPQRLRRLRVGDLVTGGLGWVRPLRLAGVQLATDFALRPGLITAPTPQLAGNAAVPSTVDVLVNGVRQLSEPVEAGRFEVRQLPVVNGLGEVSVVLRDALGRESVQSLSFYASNRQLAAGLSAYALELGRVRRGYGSDDDRYGDLAATATWRHGVSDATTVEAHGEASGDTAVAGAGALLNLGGLGLLGGALAASQGGGQHGALASVSAERQTPTLNLQLALTVASSGYRDVAGAAGDAALRRSLRLSAGWQLGGHGSIGVAALDQRSAPADAALPVERTRLVSVTHSRPLPWGAQAYVSAYRQIGAQGSHGVSVGVTLPFGGRGAVSSALTRDRAGSSVSIAAGESATTSGEFGWRAQADERVSGTRPSRQLLQAHYLAPAARVSAEAERYDGRSATRLGLQGSLLALGGRLHATQTVNDSVAVVEVDGQPGVSVFHQNRYIGRTDRHGQLVVPGLLSFQANRLAIEALDLPLDAEAPELAREVRPADRSGVLVRFAVDRQRAALVLLQDAQGAPLPLGARVRAADGAAAAVVGHAGQAYLRGLADSNRLAIDWAGGACSARFAWSERQTDTGRIGPVRCE